MNYSKYNNRIVEVDGIKFHSQKEAHFYLVLKDRMKEEGDKRVVKIELQPKFLLLDKFVVQHTGEKIRATHYIADFRVEYADGRVEVYDVKGMRTDVYKLKRKFLLAQYPSINFFEI